MSTTADVPCLGTGRVPRAHPCPSHHPTEHQGGCAQQEKHRSAGLEWEGTISQPPQCTTSGCWLHSDPVPQPTTTMNATNLWTTGICLLPLLVLMAHRHRTPRLEGRVNVLPGDFSSGKARVPELEMPMLSHTARAQTRALHPCRKRLH